MKKLIFVVGMLISGVAYAACTTHTYFVNGRMVICTTCCTGSFCNTSCM
jgi:hypothetical protein